MVQTKTFEKLALAFPEAIEQDHWGRPSYRVRGKIFATLPEDRRAVLKLPIELQEMLVGSRPETFALTPWGHQGWTSVQLAMIARAEIASLLEISWEQVAPKRLIRERNA